MTKFFGGADDSQTPAAWKALTLLSLASVAALAALFVWPDKSDANIARTIASFVYRFGFPAVAAAFALLSAYDLYRTRRWRSFGMWSALPGTVAVLVGAALVWRAPQLMRGAEDFSEADRGAKIAGERAKAAMEAYKEKNGTYTERLADLLEIDGSIADVDGVTFSFDHVSESGYRFSTHAPGSPATYRFTAKGVPFLPKLQARKKTADDDTADGDDASGGADASSDDAQMP